MEAQVVRVCPWVGRPFFDGGMGPMVQASCSALAARSVLNSMPNRFIAAFLAIVLWQVGSQDAPVSLGQKGGRFAR